MKFTQDLIVFDVQLVLLLVYIRFKVTQRQRQHQPRDMFHNLDLVVKLWFYELYTEYH